MMTLKFRDSYFINTTLLASFLRKGGRGQSLGRLRTYPEDTKIREPNFIITDTVVSVKVGSHSVH